MTHPASTFLGTFTGQNYRAPEPPVTMLQALLAGVAIAAFVVGGLLVCVGLS